MIGLLHSAANSPAGMPPRDWVAYISRNSTKSVSPERLHKGGPWSCPSLRAVIHVLLRRSNNSSEEVGLLHDPQEFFLVDLAVTVTICLVDHLLELLIRHPLPKLLSHALQVLEGDRPSGPCSGSCASSSSGTPRTRSSRCHRHPHPRSSSGSPPSSVRNPERASQL